MRHRPAGVIRAKCIWKRKRWSLPSIGVNRTQFATATPRSFATTLACEVLAHHLKAAEAAEARLVQQLYRKGRPLYDVLRPASPSFKSKAFARRESLGLDAVTNRGPRSTRLEVDQVVPLNDIIWMNGFMELMTAIVAVPCHRQADRGGWQLPDGRFARHPGADQPDWAFRPTATSADLRLCSPGRSRTYVASPDSKSGGPCRQTNRGMRATG